MNILGMVEIFLKIQAENRRPGAETQLLRAFRDPKARSTKPDINTTSIAPRAP
jgi:hypothetical protein